MSYQITWPACYGTSGKNMYTGLAETINSFMDVLTTKNSEGSEEMRDLGELKNNKVVPYTAYLSTTITVEEMILQRSASGDIVFSYSKSMQQFDIVMEDNGEEKNYIIKGVDACGKMFARQFDPKRQDPTYTDFPSFAALCLSLDNSAETKNLLKSDLFNSEDIWKKDDYLERLTTIGEKDMIGLNNRMLNKALDLMNSLFDYINAINSEREVDEDSLFKKLYDSLGRAV
ncbi:MAG: hypothetical protein K5659_00250 [Lachnospiraceae bacterium]|nr:hypothetical protein [Lachnospiraceae bacterium]